jgi:hypothetical protein
MSSTPAPSMLTVTDGRECCGFLLNRGKLGWEIFDREQRSLGLFRSQREAVCALHDNEREVIP